MFKTVEELKKHLVSNGWDDTIVLENPAYLTAVIGVTTDGHLAYSQRKMLVELSKTGEMGLEEAAEFIEFNTIKAIPYMGDKAPVIVCDL